MAAKDWARFSEINARMMENQKPEIEEPALAQMIEEALAFLRSSGAVAPTVKPALRKPARPSTTLRCTESTKIRKSMRWRNSASQQRD
jgi:hypothetical protein